MAFFDLDKTWKIWVYRVGLLYMVLLPILGWILLGINANLNYGEDILKRKEKPKFNGRLEKFFYLFGWLASIMLIINLIQMIFTGKPL